MKDGGLVDAELDLAALVSSTAFFTSKRHRPGLGVGITLGAEIRPSLPTLLMTSGVTMTTSKSSQPPVIFSTQLLAPASIRSALSASGFLPER